MNNFFVIIGICVLKLFCIFVDILEFVFEKYRYLVVVILFLFFILGEDGFIRRRFLLVMLFSFFLEFSDIGKYIV